MEQPPKTAYWQTSNGLAFLGTQGKVYTVDDTPEMRIILDQNKFFTAKRHKKGDEGSRYYAATGVKDPSISYAYGWGTKFLHHFVLPKKTGYDIDHIDRDTTNNRASNLRYVSRRLNMLNTGMRKRNTSGERGVYRWQPYGKFSGWCVKWTPEPGITRACYFGLKKYETDDAAKAAAIKFRDTVYATTSDYAKATKSSDD